MAVKTKEEILSLIKDHLGDDTSDTALQLVEDINDTLDSLEKPADSEDWKTKYEQNDAEWRKKYRDRFFNTGSTDDKPNEPLEPEEPEEPEDPVTFDDLFKKE